MPEAGRILRIAGAMLLIAGAMTQMAAAQKGAARPAGAPADRFPGVTLFYDMKRGSNGDFIPMSRSTTPGAALRVIICRPQTFRTGYNVAFKQEDNHTSTVDPSILKLLTGLVASSPTKLSDIDLKGLTGAGKALADSISSDAVHIGLPPGIKGKYAKWDAAFADYIREAVSPSDFALGVAKLRSGLLRAVSQASTNANVREAAIGTVKKVLEDPDYGWGAKLTTYTRSYQPLTLDPDYLQEIGDNQIRIDGYAGPAEAALRDAMEKDYSADDMAKVRDDYASKITDPVDNAYKSLRARRKALILATNDLLIEIDKFRSASESGQVLRAYSRQIARSTDPTKPIREEETFTDGDRDTPVALSKEDAETVNGTLKGDEAAKIKALKTILEAQGDLIDNLAERVNKRNEMVSSVDKQKSTYLDSLGALLDAEQKLFVQIIDVKKHPVRVLQAIGHSPGDAVQAVVTVTEAALPTLPAVPGETVVEVTIPPDKAPPDKAPVAAAEKPAAANDGGAKDPVTLSTKTASVKVYNRFVTDYSVGPYASNLTNRNFTTTPVGGVAGSGSFVVTEGAKDQLRADKAGFIHWYRTNSGHVAPALTLGFKLDHLDQYLLGGSLVFGSKDRIILTGGMSVGKVTTLSGVGLGETIGVAAPPTANVYRTGFFLGISFALNLGGGGK